MNTVKQICTFYLDGDFFGVEVEKVQEVIRYQEVTRVPSAPSVVSGLINLRGQIVNAVDLRRRLGIPASASDQPPMNIVIRSRDDIVSLLVDEIGDVTEVPEDLFEPPPPTLTGEERQLIRGAYKLTDDLLLMLDTERACQVPEDLMTS